MRLRDGRLKSILKDAMRSYLPSEILERKKQGFGVPVYGWIASRFGVQASQILRAFAARTGILSAKGVELVIERKDAGRLWYLLNLALWHEHWVERRVITLGR
jgi:asparagine synthase (glutamine-hydrolysing)